MMGVEDEGGNEGGEGAVPEEVVQEATNMGWVPLDQFKGNKDKWVPADEFVEKGRHVMPILLQNNKRLQSELLTRDKKLDTLQSSLESAQKAIDALQAVQSAATRRAVESAIARTKQEIKDAREDGDIDTELTLREKLDDLNKAKNEPAAPATGPAKKDEPKGYVPPPELKAWMEENPWFDGTSPEDKKRTKAVIRIAEDLREDGNTLQGREFYEECVKVLDKKLPPESRPSSRVESGNLGRGGRSAGKGYADLPSDAKEACAEYYGELVGPNKTYKTKEEWHTAYTKSYFGGES